MDGVEREKAAFAEWLARQHLRFDSRLTQAVYLPAGAPEDEVRLLEVNTGLFVQPGDPIVSFQSTPSNSDMPFRTWIADVTPDEWQRICKNPALLPEGWSLDGNRIIRRAG